MQKQGRDETMQKHYPTVLQNNVRKEEKEEFPAHALYTTDLRQPSFLSLISTIDRQLGSLLA